MIKLKDILLEGKPLRIFDPRRIEDRVERLIKNYIRNGSKGDLDLSNLKLTVLPDILKDISVGGNFDCGYNNLTKLINAPKFVGGTFYCENNQLTSLEGASTNVGRDFFCGTNNLTSLEGSPKTVGGIFGCDNNDLTSLAGAPKTVGEFFDCSLNPVRFTEKQVRAVCDVKGKVLLDP
jgi:hypothetical protein